MDMDRMPVATMAECEELDSRDVVYGYMAGYRGAPEPSIEMNRDYWHGWRNGMMDSGRMPIDAPARQLAHEYVNNPT